MTALPSRIPQNYVTVAQASEARDRAVAEVTKGLEDRAGAGRSRKKLNVDAVVEAMTIYGVDYREIADAAGVSGLAILEYLTQSFEGGSSGEGVAEQVYHAGLTAERAALEAYRDQVIEAQRVEVLRLVEEGVMRTHIARQLAVSRTTVRDWVAAEHPDRGSED